MKYSFFIILLIILALNSFAQVQQEWVRTYNTSPDFYDFSLKLIVDGNGDIICSGNNNNNEVVILKYNQTGDTIWIKKYNFSNYQEITDIQIDTLNNIFLVGRIDYEKILTIMLNESGEIVWSRILNPNLSLIGFFYGPSLDVNSNIVIGFDGYDTTGNAIILKYDKTGNLLWLKNILRSQTTNVVKVLTDTEGNIIFTGSYYTSLSLNWDLFIIKLNPEGNLIWRKNYSAAFSDSPYDLFIDSHNNSYILAQTGSDGLGFPVFSTFKYDSSGNNLWLSKYAASGFAEDRPSDIYSDNDGNVYITGSSHRTSSQFDITTIKYDYNGDSIWVRRFNGTSNDTDCSNSIAVNSSGDVFVSGYSKGFNKYNFINISYNSGGVINWIDTIPTFLARPLGTNSAIKISQSGSIYSLGCTWTINTNYDMTTVKYFRDPFGILPISSEIPKQFSISQNYPNPFNPSTKIKFEIPLNVETTPRLVSLRIFDILGREVRTLVNENLKPGVYEVEFNATDLPSGVYFYQISSGEVIDTKKMILLK